MNNNWGMIITLMVSCGISLAICSIPHGALEAISSPYT